MRLKLNFKGDLKDIILKFFCSKETYSRGDVFKELLAYMARVATLVLV